MIGNFQSSYLQSLSLAASLSLLASGCGPETASRDSGYGGHVPVDAGTDAPVDVPASPIADLPCRYVTDIDEYNGNFYGVCSRTHATVEASDTRFLFSIRPNASGGYAVQTRNDFTIPSTRSLNQIIPTRNGRGVITANDGFYIVNLETPGPSSFVYFPDHHRHGAGGMLVGSTLYIGVHYDDGTSWGRGGEVLLYDVDAEGNIPDTSGDRHIETSTFYPTAMALRSDGILMVLSRGDASINLPPVIDRIDTAHEISVGGFLLPEGVGAQTSGDLPLSSDGNTAIVGTTDGTGRLFFVNLAGTPTAPAPSLTLDGTTEHSSIKVRNGRVYVTDFSSGNLSVVDIASRSLVETVRACDTNCGASEFNGADLLLGGGRRLYLWEVP